MSTTATRIKKLVSNFPNKALLARESGCARATLYYILDGRSPNTETADAIEAAVKRLLGRSRRKAA